MFYKEDAMSLTFLSFVTLSLFMLHEFDEIILVRPWISQNQDHQGYQKEMFIARRGSYLSAESIALMIAEEFLLAFILLLLAILFRIPELALAIGFCHTLHLLGHIMQILRFRRLVPGGFTALTTFPILILVLVRYLSQQSVSWPLLLILSAFIMVFLLANLAFLHSRAQKIETWIYKISKAN
ncbi:HXXEE domain-containing protein [Streptococcus sp. Marseille-P7376]|uniref:HXXEE domain-containing protein n=1 Tax=Streptococcus sp. Marseille-P7376 TaxID=2592044 RepID=UPI001652B965|nr:HXXEE domain-containing protein [Streptococcus sp. Marseille-P7376]